MLKHYLADIADFVEWFILHPKFHEIMLMASIFTLIAVGVVSFFGLLILSSKWKLERDLQPRCGICRSTEHER